MCERVVTQAEELSVPAWTGVLVLARRATHYQEKFSPAVFSNKLWSLFVWPRDEHHGTNFHTSMTGIAFHHQLIIQKYLFSGTLKKKAIYTCVIVLGLRGVFTPKTCG